MKNLSHIRRQARPTMQRRKTVRGQRGMTTLTITLALAVASILMLTDARQRVRTVLSAAGSVMGGAMSSVNNAVGVWTATFADEILANDSASVGVANVRSPTVADLKAKGMLGASFNSVAPGGGQFLTRIDIEPAGCTGASCNITSSTWLSQPVIASETGRIDMRRLTSAVAAIGANGGFADDRTPATAVGAGGWTKLNPDPARRAGILMAVNGYGSSAWGAFVRIRDTRDPDLRGRLTVAGDTHLNSSLNVAQTATANRVVGNDVIANTNLYLAAAVAPGTPCSVDASVRRNSSSWSGLVVCAFGTWQPIGTAVNGIAENVACGTQGQIGTNAANQGFVCRNGFWRSLTTSSGSIVTNRKIDNVVDGMYFAKDYCPGGTAWALYTPKQQMVNVTGNVMPPIQGVYFWMNDAGGSWVSQASAVSPAAWYSGNDVGAIGGQLVGTVTTGCSF
ncbi:shufflon system plasmid conjugative transfer pilus tip adhesin PilV [Cupriavidus gilardii]|nr:shufflon system plasmid conjugative transfer pilus tip adhesin PilV [Cupriavidus gilardii]